MKPAIIQTKVGTFSLLLYLIHFDIIVLVSLGFMARLVCLFIKCTVVKQGEAQANDTESEPNCTFSSKCELFRNDP